MYSRKCTYFYLEGSGAELSTKKYILPHLASSMDLIVGWGRSVSSESVQILVPDSGAWVIAKVNGSVSIGIHGKARY